MFMAIRGYLNHTGLGFAVNRFQVASPRLEGYLKHSGHAVTAYQSTFRTKEAADILLQRIQHFIAFAVHRAFFALHFFQRRALDLSG